MRISTPFLILSRLYRRKLSPPIQSTIYVSPNEIKEIATEKCSASTRDQPKQVAFWNNYAIVSCMKGRCVQFFSIIDDLKLIKEIEFNDQCVELEVEENFLYVTTTNFTRFLQKSHNFLNIIDLLEKEVISSVSTGGDWSKVIRKNPIDDSLLISNWRSSDISVISINDKNNPKLIDVLKPSDGKSKLESPRGIDFTPDGKIALVTGFYSRNLIELQMNAKNEYFISYVSPKLGSKEYGGVPRDVVIIDNDTALYSNLGENTISKWSISQRKVLQSVKVGKEPNSIRKLDNKILAVSCRGSKAIYLLDINTLKILGRSAGTGNAPTGLASIPGGFLSTDFDSNTLHMYKLI